MRRRQALYRATYRGTKEMDFILGRFAREEIGRLSDDELEVFEKLIEAPDPQFYDWVCGRAEVPAEYDTEIFRRLLAFHATPRTR